MDSSTPAGPDVGSTPPDWPDPFEPPPDGTGGPIPPWTTGGSSTTGAPPTGTGSTTTPDPGGTTGGGALPDLTLRITELAPNPDGTDGAPGAPEFVELLNVGTKTLGLDRLRLEARTWPAVTGTELGIESEVLRPGERIVVERYAQASSIPPELPQWEDGALRVAFSGGSGLRNTDGAVFVGDGQGGIADLVTYGMAQPAPYDDASQWMGPAAETPGSGASLARTDPWGDSDTALDWSAGAPTPGTVDDPPPDTGTTGGSTSGPSGATTAAEATGDGSSTATTSGTTDGSGTTAASTDDTTAAAGSTTTGSTVSGAATGATPDSSGTTADAGATAGANTTTGGTASADVAIVEVLSNAPGPSADEKHLEYVEFLNVGTAVIDLTDWRIADDTDPAASGIDPLLYASGDGGCGPSPCLAPGHRAIVTGNAYTGDVGDGLVLFTDDTTLADGGLTSTEPVVLYDATGAVVSTYRAWSDPRSDPYPGSTEQAVERIDPMGTDQPSNWRFAPPTPGR